MSLRLSGKVCIITGTGGSLGREAALTFAREGASVVGCDVNVSAAEATVELVQADSGTMVSLQPCHLTKPTDCQALVDFAVRSFGRIDVLFNNAAMAYFNWLDDITDEEWSNSATRFNLSRSFDSVGCALRSLISSASSWSSRRCSAVVGNKA